MLQTCNTCQAGPQHSVIAPSVASVHSVAGPGALAGIPPPPRPSSFTGPEKGNRERTAQKVTFKSLKSDLKVTYT